LARILIVAYTNYHQDGRVKRNAEALASRGDHVDVICLGDQSSGLSNGVNIIGLHMPRYRGPSKGAYVGSYLRFFANASRFATRLSRIKPYQVVIICTMPDAAVLCAVGPRLYGAKVILDIHDTMPELYRDKFSSARGALGARLLMLVERASAWFAHRVLAVHDPHRQRLELAGIPAEKITVVMNLPDPRLFKLQPAPGHLAGKTFGDSKAFADRIIAGAGTATTNGQSLDIPEFKLICHGTVTFRLGLDIALRAIDRVRKTVPAVRLLVLGDGDFLAANREVAKTLALEDHVRFVPSVPVEQLPLELAQAAVGIVPNRMTSATQLMLPSKLLEYATMGIPIIASRLRTIGHYFPQDAVRYFEPGDIEGLAAAIEELYREPEKRRKLALKAAEIAANLDWGHQRDQLFNAVDLLLGRQKRPGASVQTSQHLPAGE